MDGATVFGQQTLSIAAVLQSLVEDAAGITPTLLSSSMPQLWRLCGGDAEMVQACFARFGGMRVVYRNTGYLEGWACIFTFTFIYEGRSITHTVYV